MPALRVLCTGPQATIQDLGRPGHADIGVTAGGACDRASLIAGNRLLGNVIGAAGVEVLLGGLAVRAVGRSTVAITGAPVAVSVGGRPAAFGEPVTLADGDELVLGTAAVGLRSYLTVRGGITAPLLFASAASSPTAGLGPPPLVAGDRLDLGPRPPTALPHNPIHIGERWSPQLRAHLLLGPRDDWFTAAALERLRTAPWTVTSDLDRVGVRLRGPTLRRRRDEELPSEGMVRGAVQVPPDGQPIVFLADHPTTGGYPVVGVVADADTDRLGQLRPGDTLRFAVTRSGSW